MKIAFEIAQKKLAILWFAFAAVIFLLMFALTISSKLNGFTKEAWAWFCQVILPTLSIIATAFVVNSNNGQISDRMIDRFSFRLAFYLSLFYLLVILMVILIVPFTGKGMVEFMAESNLYVGPVQAILAAVISIFFIKKT